MDREPENWDISAREIGFTTIPNKDQLDELKAKIRLGASKVELGFMGAGKSRGEAPSPEMYGKDERQAIKELARINDIELTTHASFQIEPISGLGKQGFDDSSRKNSVDEIKRAIDFAADVTEGGPVVAHLGEFQRPIYKAEEGKFTAYEYAKVDDDGKQIYDKNGEPVMESEEEQAIVSLVNTEDGSLINLKKNMEFDLPEYDLDEQGKIKIEENLPVLKDGGEEVVNKFTWNKLKERLKGDTGKDATDEDVAKFVYKNQIEEQISNIHYRLGVEKNQMERNLQIREQASDDKKIEIDREIERSKRAIASEIGQINKMERMKNKFSSIENYGTKKTAQSLAELGMYALKKEEQQKLDKPLYVAPENIFPESYGGHPDEMKKLVIAGRNRMKQMLINQEGKNEKDAYKIAEQHIRATFDLGHAYTWKRYFKGDPNDPKAFDKWFMKKIDELNKDEIIGHVHMTDNFGYHDEHLPPGQGSVPFKKAIEKLKEKDVDFIVEGGRENEKVWLESLKQFGRPIYGLSRPNKWDPWDVIENSYMGRTAPPYFMVGQTSQQFGERVSKDFSSWAGVPFE